MLMPITAESSFRLKLRNNLSRRTKCSAERILIAPLCETIGKVFPIIIQNLLYPFLWNPPSQPRSQFIQKHLLCQTILPPILYNIQ